jgi:hypothetical protein|tara:strand:+ start:345 stop:953 length:609 start_codon:yes stop_codon:yes gene_type:complete
MQKAQTFTSPFGKAIYPHLSRCDVRFKPEGEFKVDLELKDTQSKELVKLVKDYQLKAVSEAKDKTGKQKIKEASPPYKQDDEGNYIFKFKMKASGTNGKTGETFKQKPALFDNELKPISSDISIWGGSLLRVSFQPYPWFTPALGAGVSLRLKSVQVRDLVEGSGQSAGASGFTKVPGDSSSKNTGSENEEVSEEVSKATDF